VVVVECGTAPVDQVVVIAGGGTESAG